MDTVAACDRKTLVYMALVYMDDTSFYLIEANGPNSEAGKVSIWLKGNKISGI